MAGQAHTEGSPATASPRYDVLIVGGGTAGSVLAGRLSEDPSRRVLVLEAGARYDAVDRFPAETLDPRSLAASVPGHPANWAFRGDLTADLTYSVPRGRILGGSSAINGTYFVRGMPQDFDRWAAMGNDAWSYERVLPAFRRLEHDRDFGGERHGDAGPIPVARDREAIDDPMVAAFVAAAVERGFPEELDKNAGGPPGVGLVPQNVADGRRVNAAMGYLLPHLDRENLDVVGEAVVTRVLLRGTRAIGVEARVAGRMQRFHADEVILSAGAIASPHLLMLSGIGPASDLRAHGIPVVVDAPGVGGSFFDHPMLTVGYRATQRPRLSPGTGMIPAALNFAAEGSSYASDVELLLRTMPLGAVMARGAGGGSALRGALRMAGRSVRTVRSMRGTSLRRTVQMARHGADFSLAVALQQPASRGRLTLVSPSPDVQPHIDYRYLADDTDLRRMRQGIRLAADILDDGPFSAFVARRTEPSGTVLADDRALDAWMRSHLVTALHLSGSCPMGPEGDPAAPLDQHCRVRGVDGLRVIDTSIVPAMVSRGPAATAMMIGEHAARLIDEPRAGAARERRDGGEAPRGAAGGRATASAAERNEGEEHGTS